MLLILLIWIYITFTCVNFGTVANKILKLDTRDFAVRVILGLFTTTLFTGFWAIFLRVNWEFHAVLLLLNLVLFILFSNEITDCYRQFWNELKSFSLALKIILSVITILIIVQCSSFPYIIDNETYYIQSIKWLNEYGFVKGLANLHPYLAQMSGWHVAQSTFSFSFLNVPFNDLSGFTLLVGNVFAITKLNAYFQNGKWLYLFMGLLPVANIFLFQFISAPSPDLPIYIFTLIIAFYFIENYTTASAEAFKLLSLLALFSFYIKPTSAFLLLFPLMYLIRHFSSLRKCLVGIITVGILVLLAFIVKNNIINGYPLFPYTGFAISADYVLPQEMAGFYIDMTRRYAFHLSSSEFESISTFNLFTHWLSLPGLHGFFNKIVIVLILISPLFIYRFYNKKAVWMIYGVMCLQLVFLYTTSPQYRFFFNFILVFSLLFAALIFNRKRLMYTFLCLSTMLTATLLFVPMDFSTLTKNKLMDENSTFSVSSIIIPAENSKSEVISIQNQEGNLIYHSQADTPNFWITGDAPLPAVSREQLDYFKKKYGYIPQLRGESLADGFYSKQVAE